MKNVVIIGAGPAGITAGYELVKHGKKYNVTILEAENAIGGIAKTVSHAGNLMDIGGHRFFFEKQKKLTTGGLRFCLFKENKLLIILRQIAPLNCLPEGRIPIRRIKLC